MDRRLFLAGILFLLISCSDQNRITDSGTEVGPDFLTVLPLRMEDFYLFVNLGHMNPPGHTFPSDHGGFYLNDYMKPRPVRSPGNLVITRIGASEHVTAGFTDYSMTLSANNDRFQIVFGHLYSIEESIMERLDEPKPEDCETYNTGGVTYRNCLYWTNIPVAAGDTIAMAGGNEGMFGLDFGAYDKNVNLDFATDRFDGYMLPHTVSPLDYFTEEIASMLIPVCGDHSGCGQVIFRTKPPVGGTVCYDVAGTAQGLWFKAGEPVYPEDLHLALVYQNTDPDIPVFSVGTSLSDLKTGRYTFTPADSGTTNRTFDQVSTAGKMYTYRIRGLCTTWTDAEALLLVMLIDKNHLKIEKQSLIGKNPRSFTANAVIYER